MAENEKTKGDKFALDGTYPDASAIFGAKVEPLSAVKGSAAVVLDTNVLLIPFSVSPQTLGEIRTTYASLASAKDCSYPVKSQENSLGIAPPSLRSCTSNCSIGRANSFRVG